MNKLLLTSAFTIGFAASQVVAQNVTIPDANFKAYLVGNTSINTNNDSEISTSEAAVFSGTIDCEDLGITDLTGIEAFTSLYGLKCGENQITELDLSANTSLVFLNANDNGLDSLDLSANTALGGTVWLNKNSLTKLIMPTSSLITSLYANFNHLTSIDVSGLSNLDRLFLINSNLTSIDLSNNIQLTRLSLGYNPLTSLDLSDLTLLETLAAQGSALTSLDISSCPALYSTYCPDITTLTELNMANGNNMFMGPNDINFTGCTGLTCVTVDNVALSNQVWPSFFEGGVTFSTDCSSGGGSSMTTSIIVSGLNNATEVPVDSTLQMVADIFPLDASNAVMWLVEDSTGEATIDQSTGILTGVAEGEVVVIAGATDGSGVFGVGIITVTANDVGVGVETAEQRPVSIFPNPATDQFSVVSTDAIASVKVYALDGALLIDSNREHVDVSSLSAGLYIVEVYTDKAIVVQRIIIK